MKSLVILLLFSCGSLIAATNIDFFANGRSNIFAPLNERTRSIIYTGVDSFLDNLLNETSKLDWPDKTRLYSELQHSKNGTNSFNIDWSLKIKRKEYPWRKAFEEKMWELVRSISNKEILFNIGSKYNEEAHKLTHLNDEKKYTYTKYNGKIGLAYFDYSYFEIEDIEKDLEYFLDILQANFCRMHLSQHQVLTNFLGHLALSYIQDYLSHLFRIDLWNVIDKDNARYVYLFEKEKKEKILNEMKDKILKLTSTTSFEIRRCDPNHIKDITYTQFDEETLFNLDPTYSNFQNNSVITGMRFIKKENVIYIQIQEGQLLSNGYINPKSVHWVPIKKSDDNKENNTSKAKLRSLDLTDVIVPEGDNAVLTGVGFNRNYIKRGDIIEERFNLKIYYTSFNLSSGELIINNDENPWNVTVSKHSSNELKLNNVNSPISYEKEHNPDSNNDDYVILKTMDFGKNNKVIVPFIDIQPVQTQWPSPMSGVGLYHKGNNESTGFLALKLYVYNDTSFIKI